MYKSATNVSNYRYPIIHPHFDVKVVQRLVSASVTEDAHHVEVI
jgi:hypothetical protein